MKFKNENFNKLYEKMKELDGSDNYLSIHVSMSNLDKKDTKLTLCITGSDEGKPRVNKSKAVASIVMAMHDDEDFRNRSIYDGHLIMCSCDYQEHDMMLNVDRCEHFKRKEVRP